MNDLRIFPGDIREPARSSCTRDIGFQDASGRVTFLLLSRNETKGMYYVMYVMYVMYYVTVLYCT